MTSRRLYVLNASTLVTDAEVRQMVAACNTQVRDHAAPAWGVDRVVVTFHSGKDLASVQAVVPKGSWVISVMDDPDDPGALGWHWQDDNDYIFGEIFAKPCLEDGGSTALTGPYAVSSVLSHEVLETLCDPFCTTWSDTGRGFLVATEVCDPVEADVYDISGVAVSNFVLPEWFDAITSAGERFDYLGKCKAPFTMTAGGYWVQMKTATESQSYARTFRWLNEVGFDVHDKSGLAMVFSPETPQWRRAVKLAHGRNATKRGVTQS